MKTKILKWLNITTLLFTIFTVAVNLAVLIVYGSTENGANFFCGRTLLFLPAAMFIALASMIRQSDKIETIVKYILHFFICTLSSFLFIVLPALQSKTGGQIFTGLVCVIVIYLVVTLIIFLISRKVRSYKEDADKYK